MKAARNFPFEIHAVLNWQRNFSLNSSQNPNGNFDIKAVENFPFEFRPFVNIQGNFHSNSTQIPLRIQIEISA